MRECLRLLVVGYCYLFDESFNVMHTHKMKHNIKFPIFFVLILELLFISDARCATSFEYSQVTTRLQWHTNLRAGCISSLLIRATSKIPTNSGFDSFYLSVSGAHSVCWTIHEHLSTHRVCSLSPRWIQGKRKRERERERCVCVWVWVWVWVWVCVCVTVTVTVCGRKIKHH